MNKEATVSDHHDYPQDQPCPRPWEACDATEILCGHGATAEIIADFEFWGKPRAVHRANRDLAVRAVNNHHDLVATLESTTEGLEAVLTLKDEGAMIGWLTYQELTARVEQAKQVLARAREGRP